ncbi:hypothetical protein EVJ50_06340 [Synechococcus sp. RSCCF101]|uniref:hypothetical protein n=1 Tax=Synechococcus sp. RSCCF101 TaxID=2511069 RepID=UPI00129F8F8F|nr:hypothetical protein [Synechococcus sp. RSCCF101]QEY31917.1 hypothetical protein EVJ50_06340 [Synechococcus sp. RSCCF101]
MAFHDSSSAAPASSSVGLRGNGAAHSAPRRDALLGSLRLRYGQALERGDREAQLEIYREAVYLGVQPEELSRPAAA